MNCTLKLQSYKILALTYSIKISFHQHKNYYLHMEESCLPQLLSETARQDSASVRQTTSEASTSGSKQVFLTCL